MEQIGPPSSPTLRWAPGPDDLDGLAGRLLAECRGRPAGSIVCELSGLAGDVPDASVVAALARAALVARRCGWRLRLTAVPDGLAELVELMGLTEALLGR